jgi:hypothetical protein
VAYPPLVSEDQFILMTEGFFIMRKLVHLLVSFAITAVLSLMAPPASANKLYVSSTGTDANNCFSPAAACLTFQHAHDQAAAGDEITCVTPFQTAFQLNIQKTIEIDCTGSFFTNAGTLIGISGPGIVVKIRNMSFNGGINGGGGFPGIDFVNGAELLIDNCIIQNFPAIAVRFRPSGPGSQLVITNTLISNNGTSPSSGGGLQVIPQSGGSAGIVLDHVTFGYNVTAMVLNSSDGAVGGTIKDSIVRASRSNGILTQAGSFLSVLIDRSLLSNNVGSAVQSSGANSFVRIGNSTISANDTGVSMASGGTVQSFKNNQIFGNGSDGIPLTAVPGYSGTGQ